jgi:hypothetical protein
MDAGADGSLGSDGGEDGADGSLSSDGGDRDVDGSLSSDDGDAEAADSSADSPAEAAVGASALDAADADVYVPKAPHCMRGADAGAPVTFDAGADALPSVLALPQVVSSGGPVLESANLESITFPGDPYADELDDFVASVGCTSYWNAVTADYGVGPAVAGPAIRPSEQAPGSIDDAQIRSWLVQKIEGQDPNFPRPAPESVYVLWYPAGTTVTRGADVSCVVFDGYHDSSTLTDGTPYSYVVIPRCPSPGSPDAGVPGVYAFTRPASHELIEACTDPQWSTRPAYNLTDTNHPGPVFGAGSEIGDLCEFTDQLRPPSTFPWPVATAWSNRSARLGDDPCAPAPGTDYVYAAPLVADVADVDASPQPSAVVHVPVGGSVTIEVHVIGNGPTRAVGLTALDTFALSSQPPGISFSFDNNSPAPGDTVHLTLHKISGDPINGVEAFVILTSWVDLRNYRRQSAFWALTSD